jgi:hypothetical protein
MEGVRLELPLSFSGGWPEAAPTPDRALRPAMCENTVALVLGHYQREAASHCDNEKSQVLVKSK